MTRIYLIALLAACLSPVLFLAGAAQAVPCNGKTPTLGHCGTEAKCEGRTLANCMRTYGHYHPMQTDGIGCENAPSGVDSWCERMSNQHPDKWMKCTCEWWCWINPLLGDCTALAPHNNEANKQICGYEVKYYSQQCTKGGGH